MAAPCRCLRRGALVHHVGGKDEVGPGQWLRAPQVQPRPRPRERRRTAGRLLQAQLACEALAAAGLLEQLQGQRAEVGGDDVEAKRQESLGGLGPGSFPCFSKDLKADNVLKPSKIDGSVLFPSFFHAMFGFYVSFRPVLDMSLHEPSG